MENHDELVHPEQIVGHKFTRLVDRLDWLWDVLLIVILLVGVYFRFTGVNWDQNQHLHPDERFLTMVETSISPVSALDEYFDTATSSLNPNNRGYGFYVYGTLPLFLVRYAGEWLGKTGYDEISLVGRQVSAVMDLGTVLLVYLIATRLYRNRRLSLLAAAFAACSVLPIQLAHYFTVDTFTNFFGMLAFYFAIWLLPVSSRAEESALEAVPSGVALSAEAPVIELTETVPAPPDRSRLDPLTNWLKYEWGSALPYVLFGAALGMAMACKINAVLLAVLLPAAALIRFLTLPKAERVTWSTIYLRNLVLGGLFCLLFFRIFQPYAFTGPGFFGVKPNEHWIASMSELANQSTGDVDFPPALQWARRPITFALQNMLLWGLGLPLGILAWAGFLWMGYRMLRGEWRQHLLIWGWTGLYFAYQSYNWTRSMRYQMLVYPTLAIIAAWAVFTLWDARPHGARRAAWMKAGAALAGVLVLGLTAAWAFAFTRIYTRPVTRVQASQWIYQNVPGPINLQIKAGGETVNQPLAFRSGYTLVGGDTPLALAFRPRQPGVITGVDFEYIGGLDNSTDQKVLHLTLSDAVDGGSVLSQAFLTDTFVSDSDPRGKHYSIPLQNSVALDPDKTYYLILSVSGGAAGGNAGLGLAGPVTVTLATEGGVIRQALPEPVEALSAGKSYQAAFSAVKSGTLDTVVLDHVVDWQANPAFKTLRLTITDAEHDILMGSAEVKSNFATPGDIRGESYSFKFEQPLQLEAGRGYTVKLEQVDGPGRLAVYGSKQANESSWDDALPLGLDGYNPYDYYTGVYRSDLNFEMYWDDNTEKLQRFESVLDQADYIFISSNRQWGTTVRVPERYPLTTAYYRQLLGCPEGKEITWCYSVAEPGMFSGKLGYKLVAVFQSDPNLGSLRFNTQFAEEAFTVYDAPKVLIFQKTADYSPENVRTILGTVDLSSVVHVTPRKTGSFPSSLLLPPDRLAEQRAGGTWADLFHPDALYNRYPGLAAVLWYLVIALLGWVVYPFTRLALHGLPDRGYPFTRLVGMLALALLVWLLGSARVPFSALTITLVFLGLLLANLVLAFQQRKVLASELRQRWKYFLVVELLFLAFFLLFLFVRLGNPDLWHAWKGGEKPMDFSYFNAVLKSTTFPPYDPWFAGGYINYYYYGFVIIGVPVKWLGIVPSIAYNLILPTLFALMAAGAFSVGWNLLTATCADEANLMPVPHLFERRAPFFGGLFAALAALVLGNWGSVRMIWQGLQKMADMQVPFETANMITRITWAFSGLVKLLAHPGLTLPYGKGDWYWIPSRAIPGEPITEFPAFTFLYADPHAHMIALPITVLALGWALSVLLGRWDWNGWGRLGASFLLGGVVIGTLRPTNTWDWPTYLALGCVSVVYTALRYGDNFCPTLPGVSPLMKRVLFAATGVLALVGLNLLLYQPYSNWFGSGYNNIDPWDGTHTPFWSYMTHWGVFLFVIASWMAWETIDWMAKTPLSALNRLRPYAHWLWLALIVLILAVGALMWKGVVISWLALPLAAWAGVLLLRPQMPDARRAVLFLIGTALVLTVFVEVAVLRGDLGRMNTVFKFYLEAWVLLALSAGVSLVWLLPEVAHAWRPNLRLVWQLVMLVLIAGAALFPILGGTDKMNDRMSADAPHTLDGMAYMPYTSYGEKDVTFSLSEDYRAIQWMQRSVKGSPVIVEANTTEYRWGTRFTIYTGLPGVVGWNWHQRQQRAVTPSNWVTDRVDSVGAFYNTNSRSDAETFLRHYDVRYIIVGQLERAIYTAQGIQKFTDWTGSLWRVAYHDGQTTIYEVNP